MLEKACIAVYLTPLDDSDVVSRCIFTANQHWAPCPSTLDMVVAIDPGEFPYIAGSERKITSLGSRQVVGRAVSQSHMVAQFLQDLATTRDSLQYHRKLSGSYIAGICNDPSLTIDLKSIKLQACNHGFNLPIWVPVVSEAEDTIEERVLYFGGTILPASNSSYHFYEELEELAQMPYSLPPMDLSEGEDMDWGSWGDSDGSEEE